MAASAEAIASEIRRYCHAHPQARDTIEGITWWIAMQRYDETRDLVVQAVRLLVERGELHLHKLQDGSEVFACVAQGDPRRNEAQQN
jgi:hypothetical protein